MVRLLMMLGHGLIEAHAARNNERVGRTMMTYEAKVVSLESGLMHTLRGCWESREAMEEELMKEGFVVIHVWRIAV